MFTHRSASKVKANISSTTKTHLTRGAFYVLLLLTGTLLVYSHPVASTKVAQRTLTFAQRVSYQRAIEEVYWRHRIWPKENPNPKPSLDAVMSQSQLENQVADYLRDSLALENHGQSITAERLQTEMDRMARNTKQPEVLRELFEALGNDPFVIAECLARSVLSERLVANFEQDKEPLDSALPRAEKQLPKLMTGASANYTLPTIPDAPSGCVDNTWTATSTSNAPDGRSTHTAVWTGNEMIVWGGGDKGGLLNTGGRYNPSTDSWTATSTTNAPSARLYHTSVWSGSEMIVWGGFDLGVQYFNTGGRYNPATDSWTATSTTNPPDGREQHTAIWTGNEMIVWGGYFVDHSGGHDLNTGGRYDPATDSWTPTSTTNAPSVRSSHTAVWSGSEMIAWGGGDLNTGGRYNPATDSWTATSTTNAPAAREFHTAVWASSQMIVWGGFDGTQSFNTGGRYNPITDTWTATSTTNAPSARFYHTAVWSGSEMIVWGGGEFLNTGGRYNSITDTWTPTSTSNAPEGRYLHTAVWNGSEMILWGGGISQEPFVSNTGGKYCAQSGASTPTPTATATPTATPSPTCCQYMPTTGTGTIEPGSIDIGIHCDDCTTIIGLPFTVRLYGQIPLGAASVSSNGNLQFLNRGTYAGTSCPLPDPNFNTAILPYQDDLRTDQVADCSVFASGCGVFTSVTGTAPNRAFNIEWRAAYSGRSGTANFEVRFYENQNFFDIIYGATADNGGSEESGVQPGLSLGCAATTFSCHTPTLTHGLRVTYTCSPSFTPTPTATQTPTSTATPTATTTPTATPTATPRPSPTPRPALTPRPRPTPPPRP